MKRLGVDGARRRRGELAGGSGGEEGLYEVGDEDGEEAEAREDDDGPLGVAQLASLPGHRLLLRLRRAHTAAPA